MHVPTPNVVHMFGFPQRTLECAARIGKGTNGGSACNRLSSRVTVAEEQIQRDYVVKEGLVDSELVLVQLPSCHKSAEGFERFTNLVWGWTGEAISIFEFLLHSWDTLVYVREIDVKAVCQGTEVPSICSADVSVDCNELAAVP